MTMLLVVLVVLVLLYAFVKRGSIASGQLIEFALVAAILVVIIVLILRFV